MKKLSFATAMSLGSALLLGGWIVLQIPSTTGPRYTWTIGHILLLAGYVALFTGGMAASTVVSNKRVNKPAIIAHWSGVGLLALGACAFAGQLIIDLVVGFTATNQADMSRLFDNIQSHLLLQLSLYSVGPALFYTGLFVLIALIVAFRGVTVLRGCIAMLGIVLIGIAFSSFGFNSPLYALGLVLLGGAMAFAEPVASQKNH